MRLKWPKKLKNFKNPPKYSPFLLFGISWHHEETSVWLLPLTKTAKKPPCQKQELKTYNCQNKRRLQNAPNTGEFLRALSKWSGIRLGLPLYLIAFIIWIYELPKFNGKCKKRLQRHWLVKYFYNCEICSKAVSFLGRQSKGQGTSIVKHTTMATLQRGCELKSILRNIH